MLGTGLLHDGRVRVLLKAVRLKVIWPTHIPPWGVLWLANLCPWGSLASHLVLGHNLLTHPFTHLPSQSYILLFIHLFNKYLLSHSPCQALCWVLGAQSPQDGLSPLS